MKKILILSLITLFFACKKSKEYVPKRGQITEKAMIVSARSEASKIGSEILKKGGNAFDAMIATDIALAVAYPYANSFGGGGFMVYRLEDGSTGALDYREKAPLASSRDMYLDDDGNVIPGKSTLGALAVGVPGGISGIFAVHEKFGSLPIKDILQPVVDLARNGFVITENQANRFKHNDSIFRVVNGKTILFSSDVKANDIVKNEALAQTIERIIANGKDEFYKGKTAEILVKHLTEKGGIITMEDLAKYEAQWREPVRFKYKNLDVISMSPPSSGGVCLAQIMNMIEPYDIKKMGHNSAKAIQLMVEAERRAYADRTFYLGDTDFVDVPIETLVSDDYVNGRMENFDWNKATLSSDVSHGDIQGYESDETTHYSIVDQFGNAIAVTTTINGGFGSKLYVDELGIFMNNEMDDFSSKPGEPNMFGLIGAEANSIAPEKRMLSSMTPTLVEKDGKFWMSVGTPGGSTIITSVFQTIINVYEFEMTMQDAVNAPRFHHQWLPDVVLFEPNSFSKATLETLQKKGYPTNEDRSPVIGKVDGILVLPDGTLEGGADRRGDDTAVGF